MKKALVITLLLLVSLPLIFANSKGEDSKDGGAVELSVFAVMAANIPIDQENNPVWNAVEEATGTELDFRLVNADQDVKETQFNLMMASGDMADLVAYYDGKGGFESIDRFGSEGAFLPLEDLINEHAPNLKKVMLDDPSIKEQLIAQDGNIYRVPMIAAINAARGWFIRYDWLDAVGMDVPGTTDELFEVLMAFKTQDPNGNGLADEIPMVTRRRGDDAFYNLSALAYAFDADPAWVLRDGKTVYGPSEKAYIDYVGYMAKLYSNELLDQEFLTRQGNPRNELLGKNMTGALHDWFASTSGLNDSLADDIPGFELKHFAPPLGTADERYTRIQMSTVRNDGGWAISASNPDPVASIKLMDFLYSDEGRLLTNFGIEGVHYNMVDGKPVYTEQITNDPDGLIMHEALVEAGCQWKVGMVQDIQYEAQFANEIAFEARKDYQENYIVEDFPNISFTVEESDILKDKYTQIKTYVAETTARAVVGAITMDEFKDAITEIENMGLKEVTNIYQTAYDRK